MLRIWTSTTGATDSAGTASPAVAAGADGIVASLVADNAGRLALPEGGTGAGSRRVLRGMASPAGDDGSPMEVTRSDSMLAGGTPAGGMWVGLGSPLSGEAAMRRASICAAPAAGNADCRKSDEACAAPTGPATRAGLRSGVADSDPADTSPAATLEREGSARRCTGDAACRVPAPVAGPSGGASEPTSLVLGTARGKGRMAPSRPVDACGTRLASCSGLDLASDSGSKDMARGGTDGTGRASPTSLSCSIVKPSPMSAVPPPSARGSKRDGVRGVNAGSSPCARTLMRWRKSLICLPPRDRSGAATGAFPGYRAPTSDRRGPARPPPRAGAERVARSRAR